MGEEGGATVEQGWGTATAAAHGAGERPQRRRPWRRETVARCGLWRNWRGRGKGGGDGEGREMEDGGGDGDGGGLGGDGGAEKEGARRSTEKVAEMENQGAAVVSNEMESSDGVGSGRGGGDEVGKQRERRSVAVALNSPVERMAVAVGYDGRWLERWRERDEGGWDGDGRKRKQGRGWQFAEGGGAGEESDGGWRREEEETGEGAATGARRW